MPLVMASVRYIPTDVVVWSTAGLEGDELATAISATGAAYVLGIEYNREYFDSRSVGVNKAPRNDPPPCFGTSGYCPGGYGPSRQVSGARSSLGSVLNVTH